jgi:hypothetical protein
MFAVIEDQQELPRPDCVDERLVDRPPDLFGYAECSANNTGDESRVCNRRQVDEGDAVDEGCLRRTAEFESKASFSCAARSGQGEQTIGFQQRPQLGKLASSANEARQLCRQTVWFARWSTDSIVTP